MSEWKTVSLSDVCSTITDGAHWSPKDCEAGLPMASVKDMSRWGINVATCRRISVTDFEQLKSNGCTPMIGDVLIAKDGATCLDTVCEYRQTDEIVLLSSVAILRPRESMISSYLRYYLDCEDTRKMLKAGFLSGSAIPRVVLKDFRRAPILLPPLHEQKAIAHILGSLDDKIDQLRKTNSVLEEMASALFKSWFVDFDPVKAKQENRPTGLPPELDALFPDSFEDSSLGPIPKGWRAGCVGDVCDVHDSIRRPLSSKERTSMKGQYPYYGAASVLDHVNDYLFDGTYLLLGEDGSVVQKNGSPVLQYVWGKFWVSNHAHVLTGKGISTEMLLTALRTVNVLPYVTGAVQPKISQGNLKRIPFILAPAGITSFIDIILVANFNKHKCNIHQIRTLTNLRDTLLPKLISGELRVPEAEQMAAELGL